MPLKCETRGAERSRASGSTAVPAGIPEYSPRPAARQVSALLGIDPGLSGSYAILATQDDARAAWGDLLLVEDLPTIGLNSQRRVDAANFAATIRQHAIVGAVIEHVHAMPGQGVSSTFRFGQAVGTVTGVLGALNIPVQWTSPAVWKRTMGLNTDAERSRAAAIERWPHQAARFTRKKDHNRAEAALLGLWLLLRGGRHG
jgi:Holliday junction resolvasome RuvABC endonuclease subunit